MRRALDRISRVASHLTSTGTISGSASTVTSPAWRQAVLTALKKNGKHMPYVKYFQMATVKPNGRPANRTVVYRGFLGDSADITMVTDLRSGKVEEIRANSAGEFAWYMPETRDQFRIAGDLTVVAHDSATMQKERQEAWARMSPGGRAQFAWPVPGFPRLDDENPDAFDIPEDLTSDPKTVLENFCLVVMRVDEVDHLSLRKNRRWHHTRKGDGDEWESVEVNP